MKRAYHPDGAAPKTHQIFVFGSNLLGEHYGGAARFAHDSLGFPMGMAEGQHGQAYALPTKATRGGSLTLAQVKESADRFIAHSLRNPETQFFVTRVGCVLAGFEDWEIAPFFAECGANCSLPNTWAEYLEDKVTAR